MIKKDNFYWEDEDNFNVIFKENKNGKFNVKFYKPSLLKRIFIWFGIIKNRRYNGSGIYFYKIDEAGMVN